MTVTTRTVTSRRGDITIYKLTNAMGASVEISNLGAGIVAVNVPDKDGNMADVVIGYANAADYIKDGPCAGKIPGRYANRIANGFFTLNGYRFTLATNNGPNALHGGPEGFQNQIWRSKVEDDTVVLTYFSAYSEEGYPGNMIVAARYTWSDDNELTLIMQAVSDDDTIVNLTNHAYFNLAGEDSGSVLKHTLWLAAHKYLPTDPTEVPTGEIADVAGTPMDFTEPKAIGRDINCDFEALKIGKGYDHCWVIDDWDGTIKEVAVLADPTSGRKLRVMSDQPGVQVYTGNWLEGCPRSISGNPYHDYDAVAIECQGFPDAPNKPHFPSQTLKAGDIYKRTIKFKFEN